MAAMKVIDKEAFLDTFQYFDKPIVLEIIDIFIQEQPERLERISIAITNLDFDALKFDSHSLKGVIANFVAEKPLQLAKTMEMKGTEKDNSELDLLFSELKSATCDLVDDLKSLRQEFEE
ncbi:MAG: Hpt domain-containing protein [Bacteroidales bacterium]|jgi:HPt (histidine-containing phosphotransfer) domain-containing protein|nr:Hpt domain-containing protein [Bacteroidales bacterium]